MREKQKAVDDLWDRGGGERKEQREDLTIGPICKREREREASTGNRSRGLDGWRWRTVAATNGGEGEVAN